MLVFDTPEETDKFVAIYDEFKRSALYTVKQFISDSYMAEDLLQEIFLIIAKHLDRIDLEDKLRTRNYIITIARNYSKDYLRKQKRLKEDLQEDDFQIDQNPLSFNKDILNNLIIQDIYDKLIAEISKLKDIYRMVMELKYINEFTDDEIAEFLGITKSNVQVRLHRAKNILRRKMGEDNHYV